MCYPYSTVADFPDPGEEGKLYLAEDTGAVYRHVSGAYVPLRGTDAATKPVLLTQAEFDALEDPPSSGKYPSVAGKEVVITNSMDQEYNYFPAPDWDNKETINRLPAASSTWTATESGFVECLLGYTHTDATFTAQLYINGERAQYLMATNQSSGGTKYGDCVVPVSAGDVVSWFLSGSSAFVVGYCYFIPPKFIKKSATVLVEKTGSYSTEEVLTGDTWINGKPIYKKTVVGNLGDVAANVNAVATIAAGVDALCNYTGMWQPLNNAYYISICCPGLTESYQTNYPMSDLGINTAKNLVFTARCPQARNAATNNFYITVWYTKVTD
jgi:hypothetical protein